MWDVTVIEPVYLSSDDIVNRCSDVIVNNYPRLSVELDDTTSWDND